MADTALNTGKPTMLLAGGLIRIEVETGVSEYALSLLDDSFGGFVSGGNELIRFHDYHVLQAPLVGPPQPSQISLNVRSVAPVDPADSFWAILDKAPVSGSVFEIDLMEFHIPTNPRGTAGIIATFTNVYLLPGTLRYQPGQPDQVQAQFEARGDGSTTGPTLTAYS